jgi:hypothetical protein
MTPDQLKNHFKAPTQTALAAILGKPVSTVAEWFQRGVVPRAVQLEVEIRTEGQLKAEDPQ